MDETASQTASEPPVQIGVNGNVLKPWRKGQSGNPAGRPPSLVAPLRRLLRKRRPQIESLRASGALRMQDELALALIEAGLAGDINALRLIGDRVDGLLVQRSVSEHTERHELLIEAAQSLASAQLVGAAPAHPQLPRPAIEAASGDELVGLS